MKDLTKKVTAASVSVMMILGLSFLAGCAKLNRESAYTEENTEKSEPAGEKIGNERALEIALEDAGFEEPEVSAVEVHIEFEENGEEYDVEFKKGNREYSYSIDAYSGKILERE